MHLIGFVFIFTMQFYSFIEMFENGNIHVLHSCCLEMHISDTWTFHI